MGSPERVRGKLHLYLGTAPGVGKTCAMLAEGQRLMGGGVDVVVGLAETHDRQETAARLDDLELVPPRRVDYRGGSFAELDLDRIVARQPEVVLVDELAHTNVPGSRHDKRWQDVETLLDAGVDVVSTLNVQHIDSLGDTAAALSGVIQRETVPDDVVIAADQLDPAVEAQAGESVSSRVDDAPFAVELADRRMLVLTGTRLAEQDALLQAFAGQLRLGQAQTQLTRIRMQMADGSHRGERPPFVRSRPTFRSKPADEGSVETEDRL